MRGPNGVGKSTLLRTLYRSYLPRAGHIWYRIPARGHASTLPAPPMLISRCCVVSVRWALSRNS
ncbi:MAG: ATP-binding cassette domain-containing protein [Rhizobium sp.]|nr:ATP-binding cassette domain-containing protein [Rhizobium sp.]